MRRVLLLLAVAGLLAACTSTVKGGDDQQGGTDQPGGLRTIPQTAIGDPATADLCAAIKAVPAVDSLVVDPHQAAGQCSAAVTDSSGAQLTLQLTAEPPNDAEPTATPGPTVAGLVTKNLPESTGRCSREVWATGVVILVEVLNFGAQTGSTPVCVMANSVTSRVATDVAAGQVARRPVASPSVTSIDICQGMRSDDLPGATEVGRGAFGLACVLVADDMTLGTQPAFRHNGERPVATATIDGHRLVRYDAESLDDTFCGITSDQGIAAQGTREVLDIWMARGSNAPASAPRGKALCELAQREAARVLSRLGLR